MSAMLLIMEADWGRTYLLLAIRSIFMFKQAGEGLDLASRIVKKDVESAELAKTSFLSLEDHVEQ